MDITPICELRTRLRAALIAGTNLLSEDFRLKKAVENFTKLSAASPVFGKIGELSAALLENGSPETLLDTITLTDAVITTLGTADITGEFEDIPIDGGNSVTVNAPYSQLSPLIDALTTSSSGSYNVIQNTWSKTPELFGDYRVIPALIKGFGSSYFSTASLACDILTDLGKEIIPLLKKDFDPKGKRETVNRVHIIEDVYGSDENDFYIEQINEAEKDVRKVLVYALRHSEKNTDKLIELAKTEKGKAKTAALTALMSFDNEKAADFFNEYSKKRPIDVLKLLRGASSKWTSKLAAQLIDTLLIGKDGSKTAFTQITDGKNALNAKTDSLTVTWAIAGKWGADIEKIYREFEGDSNMESLDFVLGESVITTNDEGLKALATELNNAPKTKGRYVYSEAAAYLLDGGNHSEWFTQEIARAGNVSTQVQYAKIRQLLFQVYIKNGRYYIDTKIHDPVMENYVLKVEREILHPIKGAVTDAMIKSSCWAFDIVLEHLIDENDKEYCEKLGAYFCKQLINFDGSGFSDISFWCGCIKKCGLRNVKDLAVDYFKNIKGKCYTNWVQTVIRHIPGDNGYKLAEAHAIIELARKNKPNWFDIEEFENWINLRYADK